MSEMMNNLEGAFDKPLLAFLNQEYNWESNPLNYNSIDVGIKKFQDERFTPDDFYRIILDEINNRDLIESETETEGEKKLRIISNFLFFNRASKLAESSLSELFKPSSLYHLLSNYKRGVKNDKISHTIKKDLDRAIEISEMHKSYELIEIAEFLYFKDTVKLKVCNKLYSRLNTFKQDIKNRKKRKFTDIEINLNNALLCCELRKIKSFFEDCEEIIKIVKEKSVDIKSKDTRIGKYSRLYYAYGLNNGFPHQNYKKWNAILELSDVSRRVLEVEGRL